MRSRSALLLLCLLLCATPARAQEAALTLAWQPAGLHVQWSATERACLALSGGGLPTQRVGDAPCALSGDVVLARGSDYLLSPSNRDAVELRAMSDLARVIARIAIEPECARCVAILPIVVNEERGTMQKTAPGTD